MIFRLTQKLAKKVGLHPLPGLPPQENPFIDWTAHLFRVEGVQYIIVTNTAALYSLVMFGRGITDDNEFIQRTLSFMSELMAKDGCEFFYRRLIAPHTTRISFSKATDRHVLGSMNDLTFQADYYITERQMSPFDVSIEINESPMSYLGYNHPKDAFRQLKVEQ
jgi:hypothetical protein